MDGGGGGKGESAERIGGKEKEQRHVLILCEAGGPRHTKRAAGAFFKGKAARSIMNSGRGKKKKRYSST